VPSSGLPFFLELDGDPPLLVTIRREEQHDLSGVRDVILAAMRPMEATIVDALRVGGKVRLALVADLNDRIVCQVLSVP
jgi:predicted N-acetyltransferase YhbS